MKKNILLVLSILSLFHFQSYSQYISPGNGSSFILEDLVNISGGVVTMEGSYYHFNDDITISSTDTLSILEDGLLYIHEGIRVTIEGVFITNPPTIFEIKRANMENNFNGFRFDNSSASTLKGLLVSGGGGIKLVNSDMEIRNCSFSNFGQEYTTGTIDVFQSNPLIRDCSFTSNTGPAIMSGANAASSPQIINNILSFNVTGNGNTPQINLGTSDGLVSILIDSNYIFGQYEMAGGIAISTLAGGSIHAVITNNEVSYNRYGIAQLGNNISSIISHNSIVGNNIQDDPMQGGSGLNFWGNTSNTSIVSYNTIVQNLWGITLQLNAQPNFGDGTDDSPGHNMIMLNENNSIIYALYNNTPEDIMALNNFWGTTELTTAEDYIYHEVDDASLGLVSFDPMWIGPVGITENKALDIQISPNPCTNYFEFFGESTSDIRYEIYSINGAFISQGNLVKGEGRVDVESWTKGAYIMKIYFNNSASIVKLVVR